MNGSSMKAPRKNSLLGGLTSRWSFTTCLVTLLAVLFLFALFPQQSPNYPPCSVEISSSEKTTPLKAAEKPRPNFRSEICRNFMSQHAEDSEMYANYWSYPTPKLDGVFLELGAFDGYNFSNSYWYEMCLGWTGVLIEGHPTAAKALRRNRPNAMTVEAAACEKDEGTVEFVGRADGVSGDIGQMPQNFIQAFHRGHALGIEEVHTVQCRRLSSILEDFNITHIDFWTLDVEGAEWTVLNSFDWDAVSVHVLVIENDKDEATEYKRRHEFLKSKRMEYVGLLYNNELWENPVFNND